MWFDEQINQVRNMSNHYFSGFGILDKYMNKMKMLRGEKNA